ncbi:Uma2 family endonuclease [Lusitaniella coriacea]|uniref:Uma2 family endonuclease n=1 Tax=Lusitaniella coriacea TaxID=1983105 RepID=UPI003CEFA5DF
MTSRTPPITQTDPPRPPWETLPTMYDLPSDNPEDPGLPDDFHFLQPLLLFLTFLPPNWNPAQVYSAADLNLYYDLEHPQWYKRPDWFGAVGTSKLYRGEDLRLSYVTWQEQANPFVVVELLSPGTEGEDLGGTSQEENRPPRKWDVYERILRIPYYIVFSRYTNELQGFHLVGAQYAPMELEEGQLHLPELELKLGIWQGEFQGIERLWLRWFTEAGDLILIPEEKAQQAQQEAQQAQQEAQQAQQEAQQAQQQAAEANRKAERLAERLRELGIDPDNL